MDDGNADLYYRWLDDREDGDAKHRARMRKLERRFQRAEDGLVAWIARKNRQKNPNPTLPVEFSDDGELPF